MKYYVIKIVFPVGTSFNLVGKIESFIRKMLGVFKVPDGTVMFSALEEESVNEIDAAEPFGSDTASGDEVDSLLYEDQEEAP